MKSEARSAAVYRDFEKLYKLASLYKGNASQLAPHVKNVDAILQQTLYDTEFADGLIQFDFLMSAVFSDGKEVFRQPAPELTMAYALFCEGVRSIIAERGLQGQEILDWCLLIRQTLDPTKKDEVDLASILWRNRFPHLKIQVFNALLNLEEIGARESSLEIDAFKLEEESADWALERDQLNRTTGPIRRFGVRTLMAGKDPRQAALQAVRDEWWSLPSAQRFVHNTVALEGKDIDRLRTQLADAAYSEKAKNLVRFSMEEVTSLRSELEAYDANHIEFNLLAQTLSVFESTKPALPNVQAQALRILERVLKAVVTRFHAGLILFLIKRLAPLKARPDLKNFITEMVRMVREALQRDESRRLLLDSLESDEGRKTGFELLGYIAKQEWAGLIDTLISQRRTKALEGFLLFMKKTEPDLEPSLFALGPERLMVILPLLKQLQWEGREKLIMRCLQSRSSMLVEAALEFLSDIELPPEQATSLFQRLSDSAKGRFVERLIEGRVDLWKPLATVLLKTHAWRQLSEETSVSVIRFMLLSLQDEALQGLVPFVNGRRWRFFLSYPVERDRILSVLTTIRLPQLRTQIREIIVQEARVLFQAKDLKERLRETL